MKGLRLITRICLLCLNQWVGKETYEIDEKSVQASTDEAIADYVPET